MISTRRDLYLIMISYSNQKEVMDLHDLARFLENEQKVQENVKKINADLSRWVETGPYCVHTTLKLFYSRFSFHQKPPLFIVKQLYNSCIV